ncbi:MAG: hypothetical protein WBO09_04820, partial [Methylocystis silviterrae]|uniref:hypothetical protein n=1 Tax=Methylocystis silviterrae TaxID=2743612 RepID=UPI003C7723DF
QPKTVGNHWRFLSEAVNHDIAPKPTTLWVRALIDRLAILQNPDYDKPEDKEVFERINKFLVDVSGERSAQIHIPHNREHILVEMSGKKLPLSALGTGIHELIVIASACISHENMIICIE